jgi:hypothetical protein
MKTSTNLSRSAAGDRRNRINHFIAAMRQVGMTDAEIRAALLELQAKRQARPAAEAPDEPGQGSQDLSDPAVSASGALA